MVWIHGGGYQLGNGLSCDLRKLRVEGNAVAVTINYHLGALGFLALQAALR